MELMGSFGFWVQGLGFSKGNLNSKTVSDFNRTSASPVDTTDPA